MRADIVDVTVHVVIPEPNDPPALLFEVHCSGLIASGVFGMLRAIHFNDELVLGTGEISDIAPNRYLPPEAEPHQPMRPEFIPQLEFGFGQRTAHTVRIVSEMRRHFAVRQATPLCHYVTSPPQAGEIAT